MSTTSLRPPCSLSCSLDPVFVVHGRDCSVLRTIFHNAGVVERSLTERTTHLNSDLRAVLHRCEHVPGPKG